MIDLKVSNVKVFDGDIVNCPCNVIVHICNCMNVFSDPISQRIVQKYPEAQQADKLTFPGDKNKLGKFTWTHTPDGKAVFNAYGQFGLGGPVKQIDYRALEDSLIAVRNRIIQGIAPVTAPVVGIPYKSGCVFGGGEWHIVTNIICRTFDPAPFQTLIVR
jgi:O-acetyl-ADP-ribose deacetylase (regulator of RNase III)